MAESALILVQQMMEASESAAIGAGQVEVFSMRSPAKETPNEDGVAIFEPFEDAAVLTVVDGMGGQPAGETAAEIVLHRLGEAIDECPSPDELRSAILTGLERANRAVTDLGVRAGATVAAVEIHKGAARTYHVGDTVALLVGQRGRMRFQTTSHSPVGYAVEAGLLDEDEAMRHADRHIVSNSIGAEDMRIEIGSTVQLRTRDTLLLASDGLFDNLTTAEIIESIRCGPLPDAAAALIRRAITRMKSTDPDAHAKPDDLSFILFRTSGIP